MAESRGLKTAHDLDSKTLSQAYMAHALETLEEIRSKNPEKDVYITLGSNGVYCSSREGIFHVTLNQGYAGGVAYTSNGNPGAGDYFFGAVGFLEATRIGLPIIEKAKKGSEVALRHIGYWGELDFHVQEVSRSTLIPT